MNNSEIKVCLLDYVSKFNISKSDVRVISNNEMRKEIFDELAIAYYPPKPDTACEAMFVEDFSRYLILIYPNNIHSKEHFNAEFIKTVEKVNEISQKYANDVESGKVLIRILSDFLNNKKSEIAITDSERRLAKSHEVTSIVYHQTNDERLKNAYYSAYKAYLIRQSYIEKIKAEFSNANIDFYFVKGVRIAEHYPIPALRTMGDCDIHVRKQDRKKAIEVLTSLGFTEQVREGLNEGHFVKNNTMFELHDTLCFEKDESSDKELEFFSNEWDYFYDGELQNEFHFVYLISHLKKHLTTGGVGLRQFVDLAVEINSGKHDFDVVMKYAEQAGLEKFLLVCFALCEKWFNVTVPYKSELTDDFLKEASFVIMHNGVFGRSKATGEHERFANQVNYDGKIKTLITSIFLPYSAFNGEADYSWLNGRKYLLPIAWLVRLFRKLSHKESIKNGIYTVNRITTTQSKKADFEEWGI